MSPHFRPKYIEYAAPRHSERSSSCKDRFDQNRSGAQPKKRAVKQVHHVKYDGRKDKSSGLNSTIEKPITLIKNLAIDDKEVEKLSIDIVDDKSEQKKVRVLIIKEELPLSKTRSKPRCSLGLSKWQKKKLQKISVEKLREKGLAWAPKRSVQAPKDDIQASAAKERPRFKKQLLS